jgi:hypothetical protein
MKTQTFKSALPILLLASVPALVFAAPVKVRTEGSASQTVIMCPDCNQPIACAKAGDYNMAFAADIDSPKNGGNVRFGVRLTNQNGAPVTNAKVAVTLSMVGHEHKPRTLQMPGGRDGRYTAHTSFKSIDMQGPWKADVHVTTPKGDTVTQAFSFNR